MNASLKREKLIQKKISGPFSVLAQYHFQSSFWTSLNPKIWVWGHTEGQNRLFWNFWLKKADIIEKMWFSRYWPKWSVPPHAHSIFLHFPIGNTPDYNIWKIQRYKMEYRLVIVCKREVQIFQAHLQVYTPFCIAESFIYCSLVYLRLENTKKLDGHLGAQSILTNTVKTTFYL